MRSPARKRERDLIFKEEFHSQACYGVTLGVNYQLQAQVLLYLEGAWDYYPLMKGSTEIIDTITGERFFRR
jgi:outer membrane protease